TELLAGAQAAFAGDQLVRAVAARRLSHDDRLEQTGLFDRRDERFERRRVDRLARLEWIGPNILDGQLDQAPFSLSLLAGWPKQRLEAPAAAAASCGGFRHDGTSGAGR